MKKEVAELQPTQLSQFNALYMPRTEVSTGLETNL